MKTSDLIGPALDWAVAEAEVIGGSLCVHEHNGADAYFKKDAAGNWSLYVGMGWFNPSTNWTQGGPIIEREKIDIQFALCTEHFCIAEPAFAPTSVKDKIRQTGPTSLVAAMRCYVASKLGDEVDVPEKLT